MHDPDQAEVRLDFDCVGEGCHVRDDSINGLFVSCHIQQPPAAIAPNEAVAGAVKTPAYDRVLMIAAHRLDAVPTHHVEDSGRFEPSVYQVADRKDPVPGRVELASFEFFSQLGETSVQIAYNKITT